jgi:hypothetical protein
LDALVNVITLWLSINFGLPEAPEYPAIRYMSLREIAMAVQFDSTRAMPGDGIVAVYDPARRTILLRSGWDSHSVADVSALVHELVHHLENVAGTAFFCREQGEALAFEAQERWLGLFGRSLEDTFGIDAFSLAMKTTCLPY